MGMLDEAIALDERGELEDWLSRGFSVQEFISAKRRMRSDEAQQRAVDSQPVASPSNQQPIPDGYVRTVVTLPNGVTAEALRKKLRNWKVELHHKRVPCIRHFVQREDGSGALQVEYVATEWIGVWEAIRNAVDGVLDVDKREREVLAEQQRLAAWEAQQRDDSLAPLGEIPIFR